MVFPMHSQFILGLVFLFEPSFYFSLLVFCSHAAFWHWFSGLCLFFIWIFRNGFPNSIVIRSWSSFLFSQWKFFELYVRTCPAMYFFYLVVKVFVTAIWGHNHFKSAFCLSISFNWIACETSSLLERVLLIRVKILFGHTWLISLSKMTSSL